MGPLFSRDYLAMLDRPGLVSRVCECWEVVRKEFQRLLPDRTAP